MQNNPTELPSRDQPLSAADLDKALPAEDQKIRQGLACLGLSPKELELALALQKDGERSFGLHIIAAGATRTSIILQTEIDCIKSRLETVRSQLAVGTEAQAAAREAWVNEERGLMKAMVEVEGEARKLMEVSFKAALIRATIERNAAEKMKRPKPGYVDMSQEPYASRLIQGCKH